MRIVHFEKGGVPGIAANDGSGWHGLTERESGFPGTLPELIAQGADLLRRGKDLPPMHAIDLNAVRILLPLPKPPKILCVGLNYDDHLEESGLKKPVYPEIFARFATSLIAHRDPILRPRESSTLDYEAELAVVIGRGGRRIHRNRALDHVAGYSLFNDATIRDFQFRTPQWDLGKNFDATGAFGPWLVTPDSVPPGANGLRIQGRLNGRVMQDARTDQLIFSVPALIETISVAMTLEPNDVIITGTPGGVGAARKSPVFMQPSDVFEVEIERIGILSNPVQTGERRGAAMIKKLFSANAARIGRFDGPPKCDAVPASLVEGTPGDLKSDLIALLGKANVLHRAIDLVRYASDASPYRLIPQVVVLPRTTDDIVKLFRYCRDHRRHATFRAAGTSLNGQSQSDDILIDVRRHWYGAKVEDDGQRVRARPGTILGHVNAMLERYGRRLGPDPASLHACTIGGVIANNSGGMRCTVRNDAYQTVSAMTFVTPSGAVIDTSAHDAERAFERAEPDLAVGLLELRGQLLADRELAERVRRKYAIRNTHGYRLCALLDGETPLEIFRRLLVGSEGTLGFVAEVVIDTIPLPSVTSVAWIPVPSIDEAVGLVSGLVGLGASAVELMVAPALTAAGQAFAHTPSYWRTLDPNAAALLVEFGAEDGRALEALQNKVIEFTSKANLIGPVEFTSVAEAIELAWHVREGLLGLIGKIRPKGSTLMTEDVCFPPQRLAQGARDLQALLSKHGFIPGVAGHAAHGNLHFTLTADFGDPEDQKRYAAFMTELVDLIVRKYDGSLKAEHGTGLNMAPFVESEWGAKAAAMMWRIKELADRKGVLGPNVILTRNAKLHLENLKSVPQIESVTDSSQCIECGFCEPVCPSRNVTMTPRQRIVLRREMARQSLGSPMLARLQEEYQYDGIETCAGDGTCAIPCPIGINTGALIREFRAMETSPTADKVALRLAKNWSAVEKVSRASLSATHAFSVLFGVKPLAALTGVARAVANPDLIPAVPGPMPRAARAPQSTQKDGTAAVYFPACINRMFGRDPDGPASPSLPEAFVTLSKRAGKPLWIPPDVSGLCCSTPWKSKGYPQGHEFMAKSIAEAMLRWSDGGKIPIVVDAASCTLGLSQDIASLLDAETKAKYEGLTIIDSIAWCRDLLPKLTIRRKLGRIAVHPTCSITHLELAGALKQIAMHLAEEVEVPIGTTCCGTAGDRGLLHPELVVSATREVKAVLDAHPAEAYISANRTCEMGLRHATGRPYESFVFLLEELSRPVEG